MENRYAREWVDYYLQMGFDRICIYDNNRGEEEHFSDVLTGYDPERVVIIDYRDRESAQHDAYNDCYRRFGADCEWLAFFDFDEYLVTEQPLQDFLRGYPQAECLLVNWRVMTDSSLVHYDPRPVRERFTVPLPDDAMMRGEHRYNDHVKSIVRGGLPSVRFRTNPHVPEGPAIYCVVDGSTVSPSPFQRCNHAHARIDHYLTKTIEEWLTVKYRRGYPCGITQLWRERMAIPQFFEINAHTPEKDSILEQWMKVT